MEAPDSPLGEDEEGLELPEEPVADALAEEEEETTAAFMVMAIVVFTLVLVDSKTTYNPILLSSCENTHCPTYIIRTSWCSGRNGIIDAMLVKSNTVISLWRRLGNISSSCNGLGSEIGDRA